ncbi:ATPase domain-containing protein [Halomonas vilamensis]|uniref:ATPase domain-containing protein n=1 Tax=Vreelandella vilamensis TaxID=531309 RepID=A0ABU1H9B0_9GAMM|nr:ATPase domain-containing protein [Halomonas vilamensis]MDR5900302.1 ATPase domain-containing protein [Halomonas vilamensis]
MQTDEMKMQKRKTGIVGLDNVSEGGLPSGQATLVLGQAAAGKTVLSLQILARAIERGEGGVFVTFEESPAQVKRDAASFSWGEKLLTSERWQLIDARPRFGAEAAGEFDIEGLLSIVGATIAKNQANWVVFDGIDQLLQYQPDPKIAIDQVRRINDYCEDNGWTLLLTGKAMGESMAPAHLEGIEFLLSATLVLSARVVGQQLNRSLRIAKFRGSRHIADELPVVMDDDGIQLPYHEHLPTAEVVASNERISTGVGRLDKLLGGGIYRGSSLLISGRPGTAKSTLAGSFAEAAARRGERTLYVSFDEIESPYVRNLTSVGINLRDPIDNGLVQFVDLSAFALRVAEHFLTLRRLIDTFDPHCLVIDPVSALLKASGTEGANLATEHLIDLVRRRGITTVLTSLSGVSDPEGEVTQGQVSTLADSWIVLDYNVRGGERNRSLSIVKSRGSAHSNQERELLLSVAGVDLADVYESGSEVLMGTARATKVRDDAVAERRRQLEREQRRLDLEKRIAQTEQERDLLKAKLELEKIETAETDRLEDVQREDIRQRRDPEQENSEEHSRLDAIHDKGE